MSLPPAQPSGAPSAWPSGVPVRANLFWFIARASAHHCSARGVGKVAVAVRQRLSPAPDTAIGDQRASRAVEAPANRIHDGGGLPCGQGIHLSHSRLRKSSDGGGDFLPHEGAPSVATVAIFIGGVRERSGEVPVDGHEVALHHRIFTGEAKHFLIGLDRLDWYGIVEAVEYPKLLHGGVGREYSCGGLYVADENGRDGTRG